MFETEADTIAFGAELAAGLEAGDCLALVGDLGAGKTAFVRGLARGLGAREDSVASPTFVIQTTYPCASGRFLHHAEVLKITGRSYRLVDRKENPKGTKAPTATSADHDGSDKESKGTKN